MTLEEFEDLVDGHGPDSVAWPAQTRAEALALLMASPEARRVLDEARALSAALAAAPAIRAPAGLAARITLAASTADPVATPSPATVTGIAHARRPAAGTRAGRSGAPKRLRLFRRSRGVATMATLGTGIALPLCFVAGLLAALLSAQSSSLDFWTEAPAAFALTN